MSVLVIPRHEQVSDLLNYRRRELAWGRFFDASTGMVKAINPAALDKPFSGQKALSFWGWFYRTGSSGSYTSIIRRDGVVNIQYDGSANAVFALWAASASGNYSSFGGGAIPLNAWHFMGWSWNGVGIGNTPPLLLQGDTVVTSSWTNAVPTATDTLIVTPTGTQDWALGGTATGNERWLGGIGPFGYIRRALSLAELWQIKAQGPWAFADDSILICNPDPRYGLPIWHSGRLEIPSKHYDANLNNKTIATPLWWPQRRKLSTAKRAPAIGTLSGGTMVGVGTFAGIVTSAIVTLAGGTVAGIGTFAGVLIPDQLLVPAVDITISGWQTETGATTGLYAKLADQSDETYVIPTFAKPNGLVLEVKFGAGQTPGPGKGYIEVEMSAI